MSTDFDTVASQLLKDIGLQDNAEALNFFQTKPHSKEWKSSIKSPPKMRRATVGPQMRQGYQSGSQSQRRSSGERRISGERRHSGERTLKAPQYTGSFNSGAPVKPVGGSDGRFGFGPSTTTAPGTQAQPVTSPGKRVIARPAPKPPAQSTTAKKPESSSIRHAPGFKQTSSAGAVVVNGNTQTVRIPPTSVKGAATNTVGFDSTDGSMQPKPNTSPKRSSTKDQLKRAASYSAKSRTEVVQVTPASLQILSTSSHRILHTSEDGGDSKRKPSMKTGYYTSNDSKPGARVARSSSHGKPVTVSSSGVYDTLSQPQQPVTARTDLKLSEAQSLISGAYDRLSPVDLQALRQISREENEKLQKETPQEPSKRRASAEKLQEPKVHIRPTRRSQETDSQNVQANSPKKAAVQQEKAVKTEDVQPKQPKATLEQKEGKQKASKIPTPQTNGSLPQHHKQPHVATTSNHKTSNLPVSTSKTRHTRSHSSDEKQIKKSLSANAISQKQSTKNPKEERVVQSPSGSSTATFSSPEPLSDGQATDNAPKTNLDTQWPSKQSLDNELNTVASSTVQALSTLIEVLTPDPYSKQQEKFMYDTLSPPSNPNWYSETDDSDASSYPLSPLSTTGSEATTSPRVKSPLTVSLSDSSISGGAKASESRGAHKVRFAEHPVEITNIAPVRKQVRTITGKPNGSSSLNDSYKRKHDVQAKRSSPPVTKSEATTTKESSPPRAKAESLKRGIPVSKKPDSPKHSSHPPADNTRQRSPPERSNKTRASTTDSKKDPATKPKPTSPKKTNGMNGHSPSHRKPSEKKLTASPKHGKNNGAGSEAVNGVKGSLVDYDPVSAHEYAVLDPEGHPEFFGYCERCAEPVIGMDNGCFALECVYHLKCFTCSKCSAPLSGQNFYTAEDQVLCETDYWSLLDTCHLCSLRIRDRVLRALDQSFHPDCFRCCECGECLDGVPYISDSAMNVYCITDYHKKYAPKCAVCNEPIIPEEGKTKSLRVRAMENSYHIECYKCESCGKQLASKSGGGEKCYPVDGILFCKQCNLQYSQQHQLTASHQPQGSLVGTSF